MPLVLNVAPRPAGVMRQPVMAPLCCFQSFVDFADDCPRDDFDSNMRRASEMAPPTLAADVSRSLSAYLRNARAGELLLCAGVALVQLMWG